MSWDFSNYHGANPHVYDKFKTLALRAAQSGHRFGSKAILEIMRWQTGIEGNDIYKINNNTAPYYSRLFEQQHPEYEGYFRKRKMQ